MYPLLFSLSGIAIFFWLMMILLPTWRVTRFLVEIKIIPIYLAILYTIGIIAAIWIYGIGFIGNFGSELGVIQLLADPDFALLVWIHILCFDQLVGHYLYKDNMEHRYVRLPIQSVLLFLTLMFGPLGWLCYIGIRKWKSKKAE